MIVQRRAPGIWVFGVDVDAVQLSWRGLPPGVVRLRVVDDDDLDATLDVVVDGPGAATLAGLPPGRLLTIEAAGSGLAAPRRMLARTLTPLAGPELYRLATVSDLHLGAEVFGHRGTITDPSDHAEGHPLRCARAAMAEAQGWGAQRIAAKGDLTNLGAPHQWRQYASLVAASSVPVDAIPGNHDHARPGTIGPLPPAEAAASFGLSIALPLLVRDLPGLRLIMADTTWAGHHGGTLEAVGDDVLDAAAEADRSGGVLVILHHQLQPHLLAEGWPPGVPQGESRRFLDRLGAAHPHALVTSGHTHRHRRWGRAGVVVTQVGATKDFPGVWAGYVVHEGGMRQIVRRVAAPEAISWTDHSRIAAYGAWEHAAPGRLDARCFNVAWSQFR